MELVLPGPPVLYMQHVLLNSRITVFGSRSNIFMGNLKFSGFAALTSNWLADLRESVQTKQVQVADLRESVQTKQVQVAVWTTMQ